MVKSMTGFGRGSVSRSEIGTLVIEIQTVNRKHAEFNLHIPKEFISLETKIREILAKKIERGRVNLFLDFTSDKIKKVKFNKCLAEDYLKQYKKLKSRLKLKGEISFSAIARLPEIFTVKQERIPANQLWFFMERALNKALEALLNMRSKEGKSMEQDLKKRLNFLLKITKEIEKQAPLTLAKYEKKLKSKFKRKKEILNNKEGLAREIAFLADKVDISEEICRIKSHFKQFAGFLKKQCAIGRSLDFILQELMREINTIASKSIDGIISQKVILFKTELEKIREQVQNVE